VEIEQLAFTVEYEDAYGVLYFENVMATDIADAKMHIQQRLPHVTIKAVTIVQANREDEQR